MATNGVSDRNYNEICFDHSSGDHVKWTTYGASLEDCENVVFYVCGDEGRNGALSGNVSTTTDADGLNPFLGAQEVLPKWDMDTKTAYIVVATDYQSKENAVVSEQKAWGAELGNFFEEIVPQLSDVKNYTFGFFSAANEYGYKAVEKVIDNEGADIPEDAAIGIFTFDADAGINGPGVNVGLFRQRDVMMATIQKGNIIDGNRIIDITPIRGENLLSCFRDTYGKFMAPTKEGVEKDHQINVQRLFLPYSLSHGNVPWLAFLYGLPQYINSGGSLNCNTGDVKWLDGENILRRDIPSTTNTEISLENFKKLFGNLAESTVKSNWVVVSSIMAIIKTCCQRFEKIDSTEVMSTLGGFNDPTGLANQINGYITTFNNLSTTLFSSLESMSTFAEGVADKYVKLDSSKENETKELIA